MGCAASHADADYGKDIALFEEAHDCKTQNTAAQRIDRAIEPGEHKAGQEDPDQIDGQGISAVQPVHSNDHDEVGDSELDAGDPGGSGEDRLYIRKNKGK